MAVTPSPSLIKRGVSPATQVIHTSYQGEAGVVDLTVREVFGELYS